MIIVYESTGVLPDLLKDAQRLPYALEHIWHWFLELNSARGGNGFGANPISYSEIKAWADLTKSQPRAWEIDLIKRLDSVYLVSSAEKSKSKQK